jgi:hypothetical protein
MKEFIAKYQKAIVGTGAVAVLLICYLQQKELSRLREENKNLGHHIVEQHSLEGGNIKKAELVDSLQSELFVKSTIIGRYEVALELFREKNKKGADQFELIMSTQTE